MPLAMLPDASLSPLPAFRLRTLVGMRWFAAGGQLLVTMLVAFGLGFELPLLPLLTVIAVGVWLNLYTMFAYGGAHGAPMTPASITAHLCADTVQISAVLFLTGGIQNPFAVWLVMPAMLAASSLPRARAAFIMGLAVVSLTVIGLVHYPLPWSTPGGLDLPRLYELGLWLAMVLAVAFTAAYAHGVAREQAKLAGALAATQAVLAREERLSALDGLAAAAAHELGTPLGTIQVTAREMERELDGDLREDAALLISQTQRCQAILQRLSAQGDAGDAVHAVMSLDELLREAAKPFLAPSSREGGGPRIDFRLDPASGSPMPERMRRSPEVIYGLRNLVENAVRYAEAAVTVEASWSPSFLTVRISDDGPGFPEGVLARLGEPYPRGPSGPRGQGGKAEGTYGRHGTEKKGGLGLGFFIAKTLLERTGARLTYGNRLETEGGGASVEVVWPVANLNARPTSRRTARPIETQIA